MSTKFSHQRIPQPTPLVCKKSVLPLPLPAGPPSSFLCTASFEPDATMPGVQPYAATFKLLPVDDAGNYWGESADSPPAFQFLFAVDVELWKGSLSGAYQLPSGGSVLFNDTAVSLDSEAPHSMAEPITFPGGAGGTFRVFIFG